MWCRNCWVFIQDNICIIHKAIPQCHACYANSIIFAKYLRHWNFFSGIASHKMIPCFYLFALSNFSLGCSPSLYRHPPPPKKKLSHTQNCPAPKIIIVCICLRMVLFCELSDTLRTCEGRKKTGWLAHFHFCLVSHPHRVER